MLSIKNTLIAGAVAFAVGYKTVAKTPQLAVGM